MSNLDNIVIALNKQYESLLIRLIFGCEREATAEEMKQYMEDNGYTLQRTQGTVISLWKGKEIVRQLITRMEYEFINEEYIAKMKVRIVG